MKMIHDFPARQPDLLASLETLLGSLAAPPTKRTARLVDASTGKKARKLVEEATEVALDAVAGNRDGLIEESVDLLYHLAVLWHDRGVSAAEIRAEMARRAAVLGIAEKLPKKGKAKAALKRQARVVPVAALDTLPALKPVRTPVAARPQPPRKAMLYRDGAQIGPVALSALAHGEACAR